jgi:AAA domain
MSEFKFEIVEASSEPVPIRARFDGLSESGKTYSALVFCQALGGKTCLIDTEHHTANIYARKFAPWTFHRIPLRDFRVEAYVAAVKFAVSKGFTNIIVDSATHAWTGPGGLAEQAEENAQNNAKTTQLGWSKAKNQAKRLLSELSKAPANLIYTMRGKGEYERKDGRFIQVAVGVDFAKDSDYEFNLRAHFDECVATVKVRGEESARVIHKPSVEDFKDIITALNAGALETAYDRLNRLLDGCKSDEEKKALMPELAANKPYLTEEQINQLRGKLPKAKL